jgi:uncharacterized membrane protein
MAKNNSVIKDFIANRKYRLIISLIIALIIFLISRNKVSGIVSYMFTWVAFAASNLFFSWLIILSYHPTEVKATANKEDWGGTIIFLFVLLSAFVGLFAIIFLLKSIPDESKRGLSLHILLSIASVFCSWTLIHTLFTLKYAHKYYGTGDEHDDNNNASGEGLDFPNEKEPDYLDFAYFSFVVGMTFQVSDVQITSRNIRRLSLLHAFLSFIYNTVIVALSINIISGMISK